MKPTRFSLYSLFIMCIAFSSIQVSLAQEGKVDFSPEKKIAVDRVFSHFNHNSPGASLAIARDDSILYKQGYGMANLEYNIPVTPSSIFHVASISKQFTNMSIVLLAHQGKLTVNDDIRKHIPELPDFGETITIRHLIHHISGLRDQWTLFSMAGWRRDDVKSQWDVLEFMKKQKALNFKPGDEYLYSNSGYTLLAEIVERTSGMSLREFTAEYIFEPLGMENTHFHENHSHIVKNRTYAYVPDDEDGYGTSIPVFDTYGATSLFTTVEDLALWADNFRHKRVGGDAGIEQMLERGILNDGNSIPYAFGLSHGIYRGLTTVGHGGSDAGYRAQFTMYPEYGISIIVLSNVSNGNPGRLARQVADIMFEDYITDEADQGNRPPQRERPQTVILTESELQKYIGVYYSDELDVNYEILITEDGLFLRRQKYPDTEIQALENGEFSYRNWRISFTKDRGGVIDGFTINAGRVRNLEFKKVR